jgi:DNA-binding response OmpR family regulator
MKFLPLTVCRNWNLKRHNVMVDGQEIDLTKREFDLLHYLLKKQKDWSYSRETLLENVWDFDF